MRFVIEQLGYGLVIGLAIGLAGGWLLGLAGRKGWMSSEFRHLAVIALPLLCMSQSHARGASMFIAAFIAGLAVQIGYKEAGGDSVEFTEKWGYVLNITVFFLFGLLVARAWDQFTVAAAIFAVLSLTVIRMLPVAAALIGTKLDAATVVFMGWFGPRGLASIVLGLVYLEREIVGPGQATITTAIMVTVLMSTIAHGLSARPGIAILAAKSSTGSRADPER